MPEFPSARADTEQVRTPPERACDLLDSASLRSDLHGRSVVDLGSGTGVLAIGAALYGADRVRGVESDPAAVELARSAADRLGATVEWIVGDVSTFRERAHTVVMNPPFGAQRRHADRPFWEAAFTAARKRIYAFASPDSRTFIAAQAVERDWHIDETRSVVWPFPRTFPHHRKPRTELAVDLWVLSVSDPP
ncbi:MAG: METTL5 family protein [Thermoplasmata archaeon]|nr:METTL5 family protein [Thermoplasmata archaeon]